MQQVEFGLKQLLGYGRQCCDACGWQVIY